jgi:hypothetical protein
MDFYNDLIKFLNVSKFFVFNYFNFKCYRKLCLMGPAVAIILGGVPQGSTAPESLSNAVVGEACKKYERDMQDACGTNAYLHLVYGNITWEDA